jgi:hypothetical protein
MSSTRRLTSILMGAALLTASLGSGTLAQDPSPAATPSAMCSLLTAQEVSDAMQMQVTITDSSDTDCDYVTGPSSTEYLSVSSRRDTGTLQDMAAAFGAGAQVQVAGQPGIYLADSFSPLLFVQAPDAGVYTLQIAGTIAEGLDMQAAMTGLAALALPRLAGVPVATAEPATPDQSLTADSALEALFPTQVGGLVLTIDSRSGADLASNVPADFTQALADRGRSIDDVSLATGYYSDPGTTNVGVITALQIDGVDITELMPLLVPMLLNGAEPTSQLTQQIGGKAVTVIKVGDDPSSDPGQYLYPNNDILWVVQAAEPGLTEIFTDLP